MGLTRNFILTVSHQRFPRKTVWFVTNASTLYKTECQRYIRHYYSGSSAFICNVNSTGYISCGMFVPNPLIQASSAGITCYISTQYGHVLRYKIIGYGLVKYCWLYTTTNLYDGSLETAAWRSTDTFNPRSWTETDRHKLYQTLSACAMLELKHNKKVEKLR